MFMNSFLIISLKIKLIDELILFKTLKLLKVNKQNVSTLETLFTRSQNFKDSRIGADVESQRFHLNLLVLLVTLI